MGTVRTLLALVFLVLAGGAEAQAPAGKRVALIVANSAYVDQTVLPNPARDAEFVRRALQQAGFTTTVLANRKKSEMDADLLAFRRQADSADVALIYFAGHGMRVGQTNWLLPVDFDANGIANDEDFESYAISHRVILRQLGAAATRIAVFDACRDNPYEAAVAARMSLAARSATVPRTRAPVAPQPGLAAIEQDNVLVLFSAGAGQFASDGIDGQASPFAKAFAESIVTQRELRIVAGAIRDKVIAATGGEASRDAQRPYLSGSLGEREVYLMGAVMRVAPIGEEAAAFAKCNTGEWTVACWRDYVAKYPTGNNIRAAQVVLQSLERPNANPTSTDSVDAMRRALAAIPQSEWSRGDNGVIATRLIATYGKQTLEAAANLGDPRAQWIVGRGHWMGVGGFPFDARAEGRWYRASAASGFPSGQTALGQCYSAGECGLTRDDREANRLYRLAADQGDGTAQAELAVSYDRGEGGLEMSATENVRLLRLAAGQGNALGQANLGLVYETGGAGVQRDDREAVRLYTLSADQGSPTGLYQLARAYENGTGGLTASRSEAVRLYRLAARVGNPRSMERLRALGETW